MSDINISLPPKDWAEDKKVFRWQRLKREANKMTVPEFREWVEAVHNDGITTGEKDVSQERLKQLLMESYDKGKQHGCTVAQFQDWFNKELLRLLVKRKHELSASRPHYLREIGYMLYGGILATVGFVLAAVL